MKKAQECCRKHWKKAIITFVGFTVFVLGLVLYGMKSTLKADMTETIIHGAATADHKVPTKDGALGTETNPYVILEVVTDYSFAHLGYLIEGCEPIDFSRMHFDNGIYGNFNGNHIAEGYQAKLLEIKYMASLPEYNQEKWTQVLDNPKTFSVCYERVKNGMGTHIKNGVQFEEKRNGNYTFDIVKEWDDSCEETEIEEGDDKIGTKLYQKIELEEYYIAKNSYIEYQNSSVFLTDVLKEGLGFSDEDIPGFHVVVRTVTPKDLVGDQLDWIDRANLLYMSNKSYNSTAVTAWKNYNKEGKTTTITGDKVKFDGEQDLNWQAVLKIFNRVAVEEDNFGIVMPKTLYNEAPSDKKNIPTYQLGFDTNGNEKIYTNSNSDAYINNTYKMALMLVSLDPICFKNLYMSGENRPDKKPLITSIKINGKETGFFAKQNPSGTVATTRTNDAQVYWSTFTFMPCKTNGSQSQWDDWISDSFFQLYGANPKLTSDEATPIVRGRVFVFNSDNSLTQTFLNATAVGKNNYTTEFNGEGGYVSQKVDRVSSPATAIQYILGYEPQDYSNGNLRILDIEPCADFTLTPQMVQYIIPRYSGTITIQSQQTSAEFIGRIEDLNTEYDMIYMGLNVGKFQTNTSGVTQYNDTALNGKVYLHVGDKITVTDRKYTEWPLNEVQYSGLEARLSGNDITTWKRKKLEEFANAGYPVLVDNELYNLSATKIDKSSNIYKFIEECKKIVDGKIKNENLINRSAADAGMTLMKYIPSKPVLNITSEPTKYAGETNSDGTIPSSNYINGSVDTNRRVEFRYQVLDNGNNVNGYTVNLYVDRNADGKFAMSSQERIISRDVEHVNGEENMIARNLDESWVGVIPWKLEIVSKDNANIRTSQTGFSAIKLPNNVRKEKIRILQITQVSSGTTTWNLQSHLANTTTYFYKYASKLNDFELDIKTITIDAFEDLYNPSKSGKKFNNKDLFTKEESDLLACNYDMLIFGFADYVKNVSNAYGALDNVKYFISCGKSVLFTHDLSSFTFNTASNENARDIEGYNFNVYFRDIFNMDRFGARTKQALRPKQSDFKNANNTNDTAAYNEALQRFNETIGDILAAKDKATKPGGGTYSAIHGYTYPTLYRISAASQRFMFNVNNSNVNLINLGSTSGDRGNLKTTTVEKLNDGQITQYPYRINERFTVAETHAQYYQLDVEDEGVVVWYTLTDNGTGTDSKGLYSLSPKDATNNYYIYNNGNVTYSGVGHSTVGNSEMEVKLFINTMIAAYSNGIASPYITITNADVRVNRQEYHHYTYDDVNVTEYEEDSEYIDIAFIPTDPNFSSDNEKLLTMARAGEDKYLTIYHTRTDGEGNVKEVLEEVAKNEDGEYKLDDGITYVARYKKSFANGDTTGDYRVVNFSVRTESANGLSCKAKIISRVLHNLK